MRKKIAIIGAGMGGLAAGIRGQECGFDTVILEAHSVPGGQCAGWTRGGYTFDGCIHYFGGSGGTRNYFDAFWASLGAFPCEMIPTREAISAVSADGEWFHDYFDLDGLEAHMKALSPEDGPAIDDYLLGIRKFIACNPILAMSFGSAREKLAVLPSLIARMRYMTTTLDSYSRKFRHPLLRSAFPLLHYSAPGVPLFLQLAKHSDAAAGSRAWPKGGSLAVARNMAERYRSLGGDLRLKAPVASIRVENDRAVGVELEGGEFIASDYVVSNADGRKTIDIMLSGKYGSRKTRRDCGAAPDASVPWGVGVYLGVRRDLSKLPSSILLFLKDPVVIAGERCSHIDVQTYGHDPSLAPAGKGVMKVELFAKPSYFSRLLKDGEAYRAEKARVAEAVIGILEWRFPGIRTDIEVSDVTTLNTWERYMRGTNGFWNFPNRPFSVFGLLNDSAKKYSLPGLRNFYMTGQWVTQAGALYLNAASGVRVVREIRGREGVR